jgi:uncharacterized protein YeeX (DUF496 family)
MAMMRGAGDKTGRHKANLDPTRMDANATDTSNMLAQSGIKFNPETGKYEAAEGSPFQGTAPTQDPDEFGSTVRVEKPETTVTVDPFAPIESDEEPQDHPEPEPEPVEPEPEPEPASPKLEPRKPGEQTEEGLRKREEDARAAQREMSKTQAKLDRTLQDVNQKVQEVNRKIEQLASLQTTAVRVPEGMNPADAQMIAEFREDNELPMRVFDAMVAPLYAQQNTLTERLNAALQQVNDFISDQRNDQVLGQVYKQIPKDRVKEITDSPEFIGWLASLPRSVAGLYADILNKTSQYSPEEALKVFQDYSRDTGYDLGLKRAQAPAPKPAPAMDRAPALRSGSALPEPAPNPSTQRQPAQVTPLTTDEAANYDSLLRQARTPQERDVLNKRLQLWTDLTFRGA